MKHFAQTMIAIFSVTVISAFAEEPTIPAVYSVPVPADLQPYASYPIPGVCWYRAGSQVAIGYDLPSELTGSDANEIQLEGTIGDESHFNLKGDHGKADCAIDQTKNSVSCRIVYDKLQFDSDRLKTILQNEYASPTELEGHTQVALRFSGEPVGIVTFDNKPNPFPPPDTPIHYP